MSAHVCPNANVALLNMLMSMFVCMHICMHACMYVCMYVYAVFSESRIML